MTDDELREWVEAEHQLLELEKKPEWQTLRQVVGARVDALQRELLGGNVVSIERYKIIAGRLSGINEVLSIRAEVSGLVAAERARRRETGDAA